MNKAPLVLNVELSIRHQAELEGKPPNSLENNYVLQPNIEKQEHLCIFYCWYNCHKVQSEEKIWFNSRDVSWSHLMFNKINFVILHSPFCRQEETEIKLITMWFSGRFCPKHKGLNYFSTEALFHELWTEKWRRSLETMTSVNIRWLITFSLSWFKRKTQRESFNILCGNVEQ